MRSALVSLMAALKDHTVTFTQVIEFIENYYQHQPTAFKNGNVYNDKSQNQGSAKVFAFAQINELTEEDTFYLFAEHYQAVLAEPNGADHQNIRQFMKNGWRGIDFEGQALLEK